MNTLILKSAQRLGGVSVVPTGFAYVPRPCADARTHTTLDTRSPRSVV